MGMFDTVLVPCPICGHKADFQSKGGDCSLATYELADCPPAVLSDINRHAPATCKKCGFMFYVKVHCAGVVVPWTTQGDRDADPEV